jgi:predicted nuclease of predicted toxin-antitoxin system
MAARFKIDENLPHDAAELLKRAGHDVTSVVEQQLGGRSDSIVLDVCRRESRVLVTLDLDFTDIRLHPVGSHAGIWVLRSSSQSIAAILALLRGALAALETEGCDNRLWIIERNRVRIR